MNVVAGLLLLLIVLFLIIKCVLSTQEDKRAIQAMFEKKEVSPVEIEMQTVQSSEYYVC